MTREVPARIARSMLFVPATRRRMIEKAIASEADSVCLDLEDSVAAEEKAAARTNAIRAFQELDFGRRTRMLRINGLDTPYAYRDVIEVIEAAGDRIELVMLPKAGSASDIGFLDRLLDQIAMSAGRPRSIGIEAQIETAAGFVNLREIASASPWLEALIFGPGDYSASMRMPSSSIGEFDEHDASYPGHRWHAVMHGIVAHARAYGLRAMDGPFAGYQDAAGFERSCRIARSLGFDGKQCIHPNQLAAANAVFAPSPEEVQCAREVTAAYEHAAGQGHGAATLNGKMIDMASIRMARVVLEKHRLAQPEGESHE